MSRLLAFLFLLIFLVCLMSIEPYLFQLAQRLSQDISLLSDIRTEKHRQFILSAQMPDGGFRGREGDSDLYYTGFAVRSLVMLGGIKPTEATGLSSFLQSHSIERLNVIDLLSWLYCALIVQMAGGTDLITLQNKNGKEHLLDKIELLRRHDGGYAKTEQGAASSTYHSFLVMLIYQLLGETIPRPNALIQFLYDRQRDDGGFVEIAPMKRSGTNPTAAAVAMLNLLDAMDNDIQDDVRYFLKSVQSDEGGFQANSRIPFADGLSTFTGLLTLQDLHLKDVLNEKKTIEYITQWLEFPTGGFRGANWDEAADVEYTFYGLGTLALLNRKG